MADWLSRHNHREGKDEEITGVILSINVIETCTDIPECIMTEDIRHAAQRDGHLNELAVYVIHG